MMDDIWIWIQTGEIPTVFPLIHQLWQLQIYQKKVYYSRLLYSKSLNILIIYNCFVKLKTVNWIFVVLKNFGIRTLTTLTGTLLEVIVCKFIPIPATLAEKVLYCKVSITCTCESIFPVLLISLLFKICCFI